MAHKRFNGAFQDICVFIFDGAASKTFGALSHGEGFSFLAEVQFLLLGLILLV